MEQAFKSFLPVRMPNRILEMIHLGEMRNRIFKLKTNTNFTTFFPFFLLLFFFYFPIFYFLFVLHKNIFINKFKCNSLLFISKFIFLQDYFISIYLCIPEFVSYSSVWFQVCISKWPFLLPLLGLISAIFKKFTLLHMKSFKM